MQNRLSRSLVAGTVGVLAVVFAAGPAAAESYDAPFDTDSISRSTPSNKAYLTGSFTWQYEDSSSANRNQRAAFSAKLTLQGDKNSCARFRIKTYVGNSLTNEGSQVEKSFPSSGYYTYCQSDGKGTSSTYSDSDIQDRSFTDIGRFKKAVINICWTKNTATPPGGDCYGFTIHPGD